MCIRPIQAHLTAWCTGMCLARWLLNETLCPHYQLMLTVSAHSWSLGSAAFCQLSLSAQLYHVNFAAWCQLNSIAMCQLSCHLSTQLSAELQLVSSETHLSAQLHYVNSAACVSSAQCSQLNCTLSAQLPLVDSATRSAATRHLSCTLLAKINFAIWAKLWSVSSFVLYSACQLDCQLDSILST